MKKIKDLYIGLMINQPLLMKWDNTKLLSSNKTDFIKLLESQKNKIVFDMSKIIYIEDTKGDKYSLVRLSSNKYYA